MQALYRNTKSSRRVFLKSRPTPVSTHQLHFPRPKSQRLYQRHHQFELYIKMDRQSVYSLSVLPPEYDNEDTRGQIQSQLQQFILQFRLDNVFIYRSAKFQHFIQKHLTTYHRDQIRENVLLKQYYCDVDVGHLISFNEELAHRLVTEPAEIIPLVGIVQDSSLQHSLTILSSKPP